MRIRIDTDEMTGQAARIAAAAAEARAITGATRQMLGTAGSLAEGTTSAAMIGFVAVLARTLDGEVRGLDRLAEALTTYAGLCSDTERALAGL